MRLVALSQVHRVNAGLLRQPLEQSVKAFLIDIVVLHAFGPLGYFCHETFQMLRRVGVFEVLDRFDAAANPSTAQSAGSPPPRALPSIPATDIELTRPPSPRAAAGTASGPAADSAAATVLMAGVAVAQLGGTDNFPTNVPAFPMPADTALYSVPLPKPNAPSPAPSASFGSAPYGTGGENLRNCDTGKLISRPMSLNPVVKPEPLLRCRGS